MAATTTPQTKRTVYQYNAADGHPYCEVIRVDKPNGGKDIFTVPSGLPGPHPPYRAERLATLPATIPIYIVEGELCVHALEDIGLSATTSKGGSGGAHKTDWALLQRFKHVMILPDNDPAGKRYAADVIEALSALPGQRRVEICELPDLPPHGDAVDFLEAHGPEVTRAAIREHARAVNAAQVTADDWPTPEPLTDVMPDVPTVIPAMLPDSLRDWVFDSAHRMQAPADFVSVGALVLLGGVIGRQLAIRPKSKDNWAVVANVWGCLIGPPASMKSPALRESRRMIDSMDRDEEAAFAQAEYCYQQAVETHKIFQGQLRDKAKRAGSPDKIQAILADIPEEPEKPVRRRFCLQDTTAEAVAEVLVENPVGIVLLRDELSSFLAGLDRPGQEASRGFYLEAWNGTDRFSVDRITRKGGTIDGLCVGIIGAATPGAISNYVAEALSTGRGADGLLQRFSLVTYPDPISGWQYIDRRPNDGAYEAARDAFHRCAFIDHAKVNATCYEDSLPFLRFAEDAQRDFEDWYATLMNEARQGDHHPAYESHLMKMSKTIPALALICHVADGGSGPVDRRSATRAFAWGAYAAQHAFRLYHGAIQPELTYAQLLLKHLPALNSPFTARDVWKRGWSGLCDSDVVQAACNELELAGYLRQSPRTPGTAGGRPTTEYHINPKVGGSDHE